MTSSIMDKGNKIVKSNTTAKRTAGAVVRKQDTSHITRPKIEPQIQATLFDLGMRVRKAVKEGYKTKNQSIYPSLPAMNCALHARPAPIATAAQSNNGTKRSRDDTDDGEEERLAGSSRYVDPSADEWEEPVYDAFALKMALLTWVSWLQPREIVMQD
ncbi:S-phase delaying protein 1 [Neolecta irregularis DAH-3]|uniref:S-phase delaying protein 1 n=1 Tax=Neolecta irregularis (strain DAH-3) TaxID=1198029 RepID=A0A1U7LIJ9_NEOID|nr:S-phase delaying protein 1 [Neolecta irregularis DAH-3]|eukprot:OLL22469.1 S-phase delaying protein 1 [Neolecta irregularis DAH-3]